MGLFCSRPLPVCLSWHCELNCSACLVCLGKKKLKREIIPNLEKAGYLEPKYYQIQGTTPEQVNLHECGVQISNVKCELHHTPLGDGYLAAEFPVPKSCYLTLKNKSCYFSSSAEHTASTCNCCLSALDSKTLKALTKAHTEHKRSVQIICQ